MNEGLKIFFISIGEERVLDQWCKKCGAWAEGYVDVTRIIPSILGGIVLKTSGVKIRNIWYKPENEARVMVCKHHRWESRLL